MGWGGGITRLRNMVFLAEDKGGLRGSFWPDRHGLQVQGTMCCLDHLRQAPYLRDTSASPFVYRGCPPRDCDNLVLSTHASPDIRHVHRHFPNNILTLSPRGGLCAPFQGLYRKPRLRDVKVLVQHHTPRTLLRQSCSRGHFIKYRAHSYSQECWENHKHTYGNHHHHQNSMSLYLLSTCQALRSLLNLHYNPVR